MALDPCYSKTSRSSGSRRPMEIAVIDGEGYTRLQKKKLLTRVGNVQGMSQSLASTKINETYRFELLVSMREFKNRLLVRIDGAMDTFQSPASTKTNETHEKTTLLTSVGKNQVQFKVRCSQKPMKPTASSF